MLHMTLLRPRVRKINVEGAHARVGQHQVDQRPRVHPRDPEIPESRAAASDRQHMGDRPGQLDGDKIALREYSRALDDKLALARADLDFHRRPPFEDCRKIDSEKTRVRLAQNALANLARLRITPNPRRLSKPRHE